MSKSISLTNDQNHALQRMFDWYSNTSEQTFFLSGYAGTGKTSIIYPFIEQLNISPFHVMCACYTGKAALVLNSKLQGGLTATTIHRMIYKPKTRPDGTVYFKKKSPSSLRGVKLIIIDEASMISRNIYDDLLSYGIKVLFIGDIGQLPPVVTEKTKKYNIILDTPDYMLTEIHRQAKNNPIIELSFMARNKIPIPYGTHGDNAEVTVISREDFEQSSVYKEWVYRFADQIICGYNNTREQINRDIRELLTHNINGDLPVKGDKVICLKNNWNVSVGENPLVNGFIGYVHNAIDIKHDKLTLQVSPYDEPDVEPAKLEVARSVFDKTLPQEKMFQSRHNFFDYGYAITCHKAQGSEWNNVLIFNEVLDPANHHRWLYTAITRIKKRGIIVA